MGNRSDYNNALTVIIGNLSLARMEIDPANTSLLETINDAETAAIKVKSLTNQLSSFARSGKPEKKPTDIGKTLKELVNNILKKQENKYEMRNADDLRQVVVDELRSVMPLNIFSKFTGGNA
jgi:signal transduction histidine kinase